MCTVPQHKNLWKGEGRDHALNVISPKKRKMIRDTLPYLGPAMRNIYKLNVTKEIIEGRKF